MIKTFKLTIICFLSLLPYTWAQPGQLVVPRINMMPAEPSPYLMRDWAKVAKQYDAFVYDTNKSGQYLPLAKIFTGGINYPQSEKFALPSYIGSPDGNEAINVLPSLVGASLIGIDKSNQFGKNWVHMAYDFFNKANGENIYLNNAGSSSGQDWWYDVMPNVYFYQLYDLYPNLGVEADFQFSSIANVFYKAIKGMNGNDAPWQKASMNYRAWKFKTMTPTTGGVPEPEASGSMSWVLYNAYNKSKNKEYLKAAEWAMEYLDGLTSNPSYELQLPYGVYTAARMNAELNTFYDVHKLVNWCFDKGNLRGWGTIVGKWGGIDVSGLVGEANDAGNDYGFQMNGLHQAAMLVPMTRYDKRYSKAIGKWVLNLANANRLFYHNFLTSDRQDAFAWSSQYDTDKVIGYEALRQVWQGKSPFSTGDALAGGWAPTNLALYGTSSIGYLGAIIEKTNVDKVLKLDLLKTDFYKDKSYPSYLFYNPLAVEVKVAFDAGNQAIDIYETLSENFIFQNIKGSITLTIPAGETISIVLCPSNGIKTFSKNKMLVDGVVVDYNQHLQNFTYSPRIKALATKNNPIQKGKSTILYCTASDYDSAILQYEWSSESGTIMGGDGTVDFTAPNISGPSKIRCIVKDNEGNADTASFIIDVVEKINSEPIILDIDTGNGYTSTAEALTIRCNALDSDGDALVYEWSVDGGVYQGTGSEITWSSTNNGIYTIDVSVTDGSGAIVSASEKILVKDFSTEFYNAVAYYPFNGNTLDLSGNNHNGQAKGVILTTDKDANPSSAYYFNGGAQHILIPNNEKLNFTSAISACAWIKPISLPEKESFIFSHGSWQNRWKISITPERHIRWTINTLGGIADLDALETIGNDTYVHLCATYDQDIMTTYINGHLSSFKKHTGTLKTTSQAMLIGQMLPDNALYNFKGTIDEVVLFDGAIGPEKVKNIFQDGVTSTAEISNAKTYNNLEIAPNPVDNTCTITTPDHDNTITNTYLISATGQKWNLHLISHSQGMYSLDLSHITPGIYLIKAISKNKNYTGQLIKI
jgi:Concanavalin A-like lectin/glucanases superfamily